jgi:hypothetical protein
VRVFWRGVVDGPCGDFLRRHNVTVAQIVRGTTAAVLSYLTALGLDLAETPLLAPLTSLVVVQVTLYATLTRGFRRVNAVVAGVMVAVGFSNLVGLSWWSLGVLILSAQLVGHLVRVHEFVPEVAISAMLVLGVSVTRVAETALDRVLETLIGATVGLLFNVLFVPPVWTHTAGEAISDLAGRLRRLIRQLGDEMGSHRPVEDAAEQLEEARRLDHDIVEVDASLSQAEESLKLNPRVKEALLSRVVLRTGLDTLEICVVVLRVTARTLTDLARQRTGEPLFPPDEAAALERLFGHLAAAVKAFAVLITSDVPADADTAEDRLMEELSAVQTARDRAADLLLAGVQRYPRQWQLHGALLAQVDRVLAELDVEKRSMRLAEELDRYSQQKADRYPRLRRLRERLRLPGAVRRRKG